MLTLFGLVLDMLRDYQQDMLDRLCEAWQRHRSVLVQMPTGTGKTVLMAEAIKRLRMEDGEWRMGCADRVLIVAHRRELIEQIRRSLPQPLQREGSVVVESIQKLSRELSKAEFLRPFGSKRPEVERSILHSPFSIIIVDEAHHALARTYRMLWERWPEAKFLGLTATPCRLNGAAFTDR